MPQDRKKTRRWHPSLKGTEYEEICRKRNLSREWYSKRQVPKGTKYDTQDFAQRLLNPHKPKPFD